jgi:nitrate/nitrite-specific signal transduction histidine kinase
MRIMSDRARMIRGSLDVRTLAGGGALVTCRFPLTAV